MSVISELAKVALDFKGMQPPSFRQTLPSTPPQLPGSSSGLTSPGPRPMSTAPARIQLPRPSPPGNLYPSPAASAAPLPEPTPTTPPLPSPPEPALNASPATPPPPRFYPTYPTPLPFNTALKASPVVPQPPIASGPKREEQLGQEFLYRNHPGSRPPANLSLSESLNHVNRNIAEAARIRQNSINTSLNSATRAGHLNRSGSHAGAELGGMDQYNAEAARNERDTNHSEQINNYLSGGMDASVRRRNPVTGGYEDTGITKGDLVGERGQIAYEQEERRKQLAARPKNYGISQMYARAVPNTGNKKVLEGPVRSDIGRPGYTATIDKDSDGNFSTVVQGTQRITDEQREQQKSKQLERYRQRRARTIAKNRARDRARFAYRRQKYAEDFFNPVSISKQKNRSNTDMSYVQQLAKSAAYLSKEADIILPGLIGAGVGALKSEEGEKSKGTLQGGLTGAGTGLGASAGGLLGGILGGAVGGLPGIAAGGLAGAGLGGYGGFKGTNALQRAIMAGPLVYDEDHESKKKKDKRDGDGDGKINDGTPEEKEAADIARRAAILLNSRRGV